MSLPDAHPQADTSPEERSRFTVVALSFGVLVVTCAAATYLELKTHSAHLAMSNLPLVVLIPFVIALTLNVLLKRFLPRLSLTSRELRLLLSVWLCQKKYFQGVGQVWELNFQAVIDAARLPSSSNCPVHASM